MDELVPCKTCGSEIAKNAKVCPNCGAKNKTQHRVNATLVSVESHNGYVLCEFEIVNNTSKDIRVSSLLSFDCYVDDYATDLDLGALLDTDKPQLDGAVASGKKMRGVLAFKAPSGWKEIEIHYHPSFWSKAIIFSAIHE